MGDVVGTVRRPSAAQERATAAGEVPAGQDGREARLPIAGMTCAACVRRVEKALGKVAGVTAASVNLATETATVRYDPVAASPEQLAAAVERAGYPVRELPAEVLPAASPSTPAFVPATVPDANGAIAPANGAAPATAGAVLPIAGMTCAACVRRVERALVKVPGVNAASVNLATERATVAYDPAAVDPARLGAAVEQAGYRVPNLSVGPTTGPVPNPALGTRDSALNPRTLDLGPRRTRGSGSGSATGRSPTCAARRWSAWRSAWR